MADEDHRPARHYRVGHGGSHQKARNGDLDAGEADDSEPPIVHRTAMKVAADKTAVVTLAAKSTESVASLMSSAMRYSGFL